MWGSLEYLDCGLRGSTQHPGLSKARLGPFNRSRNISKRWLTRQAKSLHCRTVEVPEALRRVEPDHPIPQDLERLRL